MKRNEIIKINNIDFKYKGIKSINYVENMRYKTLTQCYNKPSTTKIYIYNNWLDLLTNDFNILVERYGICGYNCNMFSLNAIIKIGNELYYLYITKTRNEIYRVLE